jgi:myo-inositol-1(or 4)-monophosphatase
MNLEALCREVVALSEKAGSFILEERKRFNTSTVEHKGHNDLVSYVDKHAEAIIVEGLTELLPEAGFIAEEGTSLKKGERFEWIVDPLDGTTNFIHGVPCFCVSIALYENGQPVLGVVHELNQRECFYAWKDGGAWMNGTRIRVSNTATLADALIATGFPYHDYDRMEPYMKVFDHCMRYTRGLRRLGSAAADLAYLAAGRFDVFYEYGLNPYDVAAGVVLVQEAGGTVTDFSGGNNHTFGREIIASNSLLHPPFLDVLKESFQSR